ncbi:uncharacterized protein LOC124716681 [Schistocerca piceifrons]|uniref:uncharacterized protein LOC124716681 n=1 Tax=Schistocerca piceifrons TaxID=274613 RepID=UPI001F5F5E31|nr:uncharacterized protein LOC124716681 [Schistocerca piceifrons]
MFLDSASPLLRSYQSTLERSDTIKTKLLNASPPMHQHELVTRQTTTTIPEYDLRFQYVILKSLQTILQQDSERILPYYIKAEMASPASFVSPGCEAKYDFENNHLPQPSTCPCAIKRICPYEVCNELGICSTWAETRMHVDADIQADSFECGFPIKCIKCGKAIQDRSSCQQRYLIPIYECNSCIAHGTTGPDMTSYLESIAGHNTAADPRIVPCEYCKKKFETVRGMRIHVGHVHKGARAKH